MKQCQNSVKTVSKRSKTQSNGRVKVYNCINPPGTLKLGGLYTPRFSYGTSETAVQACPVAPLVLGVVHVRCGHGEGRVGIPGG